MARPRQYSDEERHQRALAAKARWRAKNKDKLREQAQMFARVPAIAQQTRIYRRALYAAKRQALIEAGYEPRPVGRPRVQRSSDENILLQYTKPSTTSTTTDDSTTASE